MYDDPMPVVVFGSTGLVGGAVARALLRDRRFQVKAVTRTPTTDVARKLAEEVTADLNDPRSLKRAMEGAHAVFLTTHYWEHMNHDKEVAQGKNAVDAAVNAGVAHFVFYGSESPKDTIDKNFLGIFKPHKVKPGVYAVAIPMEDTPLDCMSAKDVGRCVVSVLLRPKAHLCRELPLTAEKLTVQQITDCFNKHFNDRKFICPKIRVKDYEKFGFAGAADIAAMFAFYQSGQEPRDIKATRRVQGSLCSFDRWVADNKEKLTEAMTE
ncbi:hypothetical protein BaRGS_00032876 [Batillaria attramentaria]|uniref:NmrA-like family domain-containing protein 1 n=1 Tax=Batillaria attramentaria TaxID=370345 RepID=A0ABD0JM84_9CAEN